MLNIDTKALIFTAGQRDQFGRATPLAVSGRTHDGRRVTAVRNVLPSVACVEAALATATGYKMTELTVHYDGCG